MLRRLYRIMQDFFQGMGRLNLSTYAAAGAFYIFLSLVPLALLICSILPYTPLTKTMLLDWLGNLLPDYFGYFLETILNLVYSRSTAVLSLSLLVTIWSASKALSSVMQGLGQVTRDPLGRRYFRRRLWACVWTLIFLLSLVLTASLLVFGQKWIPHGEWINRTVDTLLRLRFLVMFPALTIVFLIIYRWFITRRLPFGSLLPGAMFASGAWLVFSFFFAIYVSDFGDYSLYGSMAAVVVAMLWMYYCLYLVLIGQYLNVFLLRRRRMKWFFQGKENAERARRKRKAALAADLTPEGASGIGLREERQKPGQPHVDKTQEEA